MKIFIIGLILLISPLILMAHNPLSARYHLEGGENVSLLTINLSQNGVNQALLKEYGKERLEGIQRMDLEELIVDYVKSNFSLELNRNKIELSEGGIKLGSHQTDLKFVLPPISEKIERMEINIPAFNENENHQTIFAYQINGNSDRLILSSSNNFRSKKVFHKEVVSAYRNWFIIGGTLILISFIFLAWNRSLYKGVKISY